MTEFNKKFLAVSGFLLLLCSIAFSNANSQPGWTLLSSGVSSDLNSVHFINTGKGFAVGDNGLILKTVDSGTNWDIVSSNTGLNLNAITFIGNEIGFIIGDSGVILRSSNAGNTWDKYNSGIRKNLNSIVFTSSQEGHISGDGVVLSTYDGGFKWIPTIIAGEMNSICFPEPSTGYIYNNEYNILLKSTNSGNTWAVHAILPGSITSTINFVNPNTGFIVGGEIASISKTTNGGANWNFVYNPGTQNHGMYNTYFTSDNEGFTIGKNGTILKSDNGGSNWHKQTSTTHSTLNSIFFADKVHGWVVGENGTILYTSTGGVAESEIKGKVTYNDSNTPVSSGYVKAIGYDSETGELIVLDSVPIQPNGDYALNVTYDDSTDIMAYQDDETDYAPTFFPSALLWEDAVSLHPSQTRTDIDIRVHRIDTSSVVDGHVSGRIYKKLEPGFDFLKGAVIYVKTGDTIKGYSTSLQDGSYGFDLPYGDYKLFISRIGYRSDSTVINFLPPASTMDSVNFTMLPFTVGIVELPRINPNLYRLQQNYPNPFNPSTFITYYLPQYSTVNLSIYDIAGRTVSTLVNSNQAKGEYTVKFSGEGLTSGIYFYKLVTPVSSKTKKMLLLK